MDIKPYRILIVDDSAEDRETYRGMLAEGGEGDYLFTEAETGEKGLELCRDAVYHCVLLDCDLPDCPGLEVLRELHNDNRLPEIAVIFLSDPGNVELAAEAMKSGAQDFLVKGQITSEGLRRAVLNAIVRVGFLRKAEEQRRELQLLATFDGLTGLYNRRCFMERIEEEMNRAARYELPLTLLLMDIDHFKRVNDRYGHLVGDKILTAVAQILKTLRRTDFAGRYGGEEFGLLSTNTDLPGGAALAERLRKRIATQVAASVDENMPSVTCSFGIAQFGPEMKSISDLFKSADAALYRAKESGRNCVVLAPLSKHHRHKKHES